MFTIKRRDCRWTGYSDLEELRSKLISLHGEIAVSTTSF
jgi:hypothetical protein